MHNNHQRQDSAGMIGPRGMDIRKVSLTLQHQRSTKQLINRFESMDSAAASSSVPHLARARPRSRDLQVPKSKSPPFAKKDTSPLRQSFRNLISVFKKGKGTNKERHTDHGESSPKSHAVEPALSLAHESLNSFAPLPNDDHFLSTTIETPLHSGSLLYLSHSLSSTTASPILPVWTACSATLYHNRIVITWHTAQGNPFIHTIDLGQCADVRSLSLNQIDRDERALLPLSGNPDGIRVFEILFEGRPREKFVATSVQNRAGWVSAIWEAVLPSQERYLNISEDIKIQEDAQYPLAREQRVKELPELLINPSMRSYCTERSLPPTPAGSPPSPFLPLPTPTRIPLHDYPRLAQPMSPSVYPLSPSSAVSRVSSASTYCSKSPSIANLDRRSVVKQRLAHIETTLSSSTRSSTPGLTTPALSSSCSRRPSLATPRSEKADLALIRTTSIHSSAGDSIVDAYGDVEAMNTHTDNSLLNFKRAESSHTEPKLKTGADPFSINKHQGLLDSPPSTILEFPMPPLGFEPLAGLLYDQTAKHGEQATALGDQIVSLQHDMQNLSLGVASLKPTLITDIRETLSSGTDSKGLRQKLDDLAKDIRHQSSGSGEVLRMLEALRNHLGSELPKVFNKLEEIQISQASGVKNVESVMNMKNVKPAGLSEDDTELPLSSAPALSDLSKKLDMLLTFSGPSGQTLDTVGLAGQVENVERLLKSLQTDETQRKVQAQQQTDSVRYLNELNSWLEAFVNDGTSQIQAVAKGVEQLCKELGCGTNHSVPGSYSNPLDEGAPGSLQAEIRQLLIETRARDQNTASFQTSMNTLIDIINDDRLKNADSRNAFTPECVVGMIDWQRQDQEGLLRALTTELSNEIRGERLRFVEAMKEATAINVQVHVEQFKKELTREVLGMTQEVGRLHREKQVIENQITELFTFYSKQKAGVSVPPPPPRLGESQPSDFNQQHSSYLSGLQRRPLPNPSSRR